MTNTTNTAVYTFAPNAITCNGQTFPAEYSINPTSDNVFAFITIAENDGKPVTVRLKVEPSEAEYPLILKAAQQERESRKAEQEKPAPVELFEYYTLRRPPMPGGIPSGAVSTEECEPRTIPGRGTVHGYARYNRELTAQEIADYELCPVYTGESEQEQPAAVEPVTVEPVTVEPVTVEPVQNAAETVEAAPVEQERDPKQVRGPIPEKSFIGLEIKGNGWKILFDGDHERTRVIFKREPSAAAKATVEKSGFYWSPVLQSWNKKLTFKAFRAAQALANDLRAVCG